MESKSINERFILNLNMENTIFDVSKKLIILTFDDNYVNQAINLIFSIAQYHKENVSYICICPRLKQHNIDELLSIEYGIQVRCYDTFCDIDSGRWPECAYFRIFLPWLLEESIHTVLYLDPDIICTGSIEKLLETRTKCIARCPELRIHVNADMQKEVQRYLPTQLYCNSGVCILNLDTLRNEFLPEKLYSAICEMSPKLMFCDQDFMNYYFKGRIEILNGYMYNFLPYELRGSRYYQQALNNCRLIHFATSRKPWNYKCELYLMRLYLKYTTYAPMRKIVKCAMRKSYLHAFIRLNRPFRHWVSNMRVR